MRSMSKYFSLEVGLRDNRGTTRRFRLANYQKKDHITDELCLLPLQLDDDWNQLRIDLANLVRRAYGSTYTHAIIYVFTPTAD
ncbi:Cilia/flagella-associated protein 20/WDR90/C3orf67 [Syncephalis fuscata]|nr:Cilia/flagella-associated protein 20/WDR90/C3orf67 [Syncephalis fuscata]